MNKKPLFKQNLKPLLMGWILSLLLTLAAYFIAIHQQGNQWAVSVEILGLCTLQAIIQLICFFQLGIEPKPHWNLITFLFMLLLIIIVIGGSLWIMYNLDYNMMLKMGE